MLLIEMDMPKNCIFCPMSHWNKLDEWTGCDAVGGKRFAATTDNEYSKMEGRPDWCPIKGVLPEQHGDLIDRDKAKDAFDSSFLTFRMKDGETMRGFYQRTIAELPTVIAAESEADADYQLSVLMQEYFERYEPTYNSEDGSM